MRNDSNFVKNADEISEISEIENKITVDHDNDKQITTQVFNQLILENFTAKLAQITNLASKSNVANFVKKTDFDNKLKNVTSNKNELNELLKKVKAVSTKGGAKYFSLRIFQNYLVFKNAKRQLKKTSNILVALLGLIRGNLIEC